MKIYFISLLLFIILYSNSSNSENLYLFSSIGIADYEINSKDKTEINNKLTSIGFGSATTSSDTNNLTYKVGFGLKVPLNFFVEGSYVNYGKIKFSATTTSPSESLSADVAVKGFSADLLKQLGPFDLTAGFMMVDDDIVISSSKGNVDVPIDEFILPKIGTNFKFNDYRFELNRIFITPNSHVNSFMIGYVVNIF